MDINPIPGQPQGPLMQDTQPVVPTPKHVTPKLIVAIVIVLALAGAAYGAIWYWGDNNSRYGFEGTLDTYTPRPSASAIPADWKTYTNTKYWFEFKYPENWYVSRDGTAFVVLSNYQNWGSFDGTNVPENFEQIFIVANDVNTQSLDDLKPQSDEHIQLISFEKFLTADGMEGRKRIIREQNKNHTSIIFINNSIKVAFSLGSQSEDQVDLLSQILSTFKFIK